MTAAKSQSPSALWMLQAFTLSRSLLEMWWETSVQQLEAMGSMATRKRRTQHKSAKYRLALILKVPEKHCKPTQASASWGLHECKDSTCLDLLELKLYYEEENVNLGKG